MDICIRLTPELNYLNHGLFPDECAHEPENVGSTKAWPADLRWERGGCDSYPQDYSLLYAKISSYDSFIPATGWTAVQSDSDHLMVILFAFAAWISISTVCLTSVWFTNTQRSRDQIAFSFNVLFSWLMSAPLTSFPFYSVCVVQRYRCDMANGKFLNWSAISYMAAIIWTVIKTVVAWIDGINWLESSILNVDKTFRLILSDSDTVNKACCRQ
jgi:hypothetical protein